MIPAVPVRIQKSIPRANPRPSKMVCIGANWSKGRKRGVRGGRQGEGKGEGKGEGEVQLTLASPPLPYDYTRVRGS